MEKDNMNTQHCRLLPPIANLLVIVALLIGLGGLPSAQMPRAASAAQPPSLAKEPLPRAMLFKSASPPLTAQAAPQALSGNALDFDGVNDYVNIPDANNLDLVTNYTLEAWIYPRTLGDYEGIISKFQTDTTNGYVLRVMADGRIDFDNSKTAVGTISTQQWYHIAAVNAGGTRSLYVNGLSVPLTGTPITVLANTDPLRLGEDYADAPRFFDGQMDEVRVWNTARAAAQIRDNMYHELAGSESGLVAYYKLNESGTTSTAADSAGGDNPGTLTNMTLPGAWRTSGAFGGPKNALDFDGVNDYAQVSGGLPLANASITVEAWARRDTMDTFQMIVSQGPASSNHGLHVGFRNTNVFMCGFYNNDLYTPAFIDTDWHH